MMYFVTGTAKEALMFFYDRTVLPIVSTESPVLELDWESIRKAVCEHPCNIILVERGNKLAGIISHGDVIRAREAGADAVAVNTNFTALQGKRFMEAREIFRARKNIHELPVIDEEGKLEGVCSRFDDLLYLEYSNPWKANKYVEPFLKKLKRASFVRPPAEDDRRRAVVNTWVEHFREQGVQCDFIDFESITEVSRKGDPILLTDREQELAAHMLLEAIDGKPYSCQRLHTLKCFEDQMSEHAYDDLVQKLVASGISVYNLIFTTDNSTPGRKRLNKGFNAWFDTPIVQDVRPFGPNAQAEAFYGEHYTKEYAEAVGKLTIEVEKSDIFTRLKDCEGPYFNVVDGERVTPGQPSDAQHTIYFFGPCIAIGSYVEDRHTIESFLQKRLNETGYHYKVVNCGCYETRYQEMVHITSTPMKPGDIIVAHIENRDFPKTTTIDLMDLLDAHDVPSEWLLDMPMHCNHKVNEIYANEIFNHMVAEGTLKLDENENLDPTKVEPVMLSRDLAVNSLYLDLYFNDFHPKEGMTVGSIGMHGNPFTLGHRYLIETASKQVDRLFVLLIGDELGIFSYPERFAMAVDATSDLDNVTIVSGGPFQATRNVFRDYFVKINPSDMTKSALADTLIYAEVIAKRLGITHRFLGDEKHNPKMDFFNKLLLETLPKYGITAVELPRLAVHGHSISASTSRNAAIEGDLETLLDNVPAVTLKYLIGS